MSTHGDRDAKLKRCDEDHDERTPDVFGVLGDVQDPADPVQDLLLGRVAGHAGAAAGGATEAEGTVGGGLQKTSRGSVVARVALCKVVQKR